MIFCFFYYFYLLLTTMGSVISVLIVVILVCIIIIYNLNEKLPPRNENVFKLLGDFKNNIIRNKNIYTLNDINNIINTMVDLYISNKCDFIEEYNNKCLLNYAYELQSTDTVLYRKLKRRKIINDIKSQIELIHKNELTEQMMIEINMKKELLSSNELKDFTVVQVNILKNTLKQHKLYLDDLFTLIEHYNEQETISNIV